MVGGRAGASVFIVSDGSGPAPVTLPPPRYPDDMTPTDDKTKGGEAGEVLISGLDTGPDADTRANLTPTERLVRLEEAQRPEPEPEDEDG